jgi:predicted Ser/Thr protein kinase
MPAADASRSGPTRLGRYEIQAELGQGSMGVVYLARDPLIGRLVALKVFRPHLGADPEEVTRFRSRFLREAQSAGILSHRNIVTIHDVVEEGPDGTMFIAMEYVQGSNLKDLLRYGRTLDLPGVVDIVSQIAEALDYAHERGVVHRDVKPANVLLTPEREVKITDFGIARFDTSNITSEGQLLGTPNYMSPEQVQGQEVDRRSDLFSLGVIVYELITRQKPFKADSVASVTHRIVYEPYTPAEDYVGHLPDGLGELFARALAKLPDERYQRAGDLARDLAVAVRAYEAEVALSDTRNLPVAPSPVEEGAGDPVDHDTLPGVAPPEEPPPPVPGWRRALGPVGVALAGVSRTAGELTGHLTARLAPWGRPPIGRLALVALGAVVVSLAAAAPLLFLGARDDGGPVATSSAHEEQMEYLRLVREGSRQRRDGDPVAAAVSFGRAALLGGPGSRAADLRREAELEAKAQQESALERSRVELQAAAARAALEARRYTEALATAGVVLEVEPEHEAARDVARRARAALAREAERRSEAAEGVAAGPEMAPPPAVADETSATSSDTVAQEGFLTLHADLHGEGRVRLRDGERLLFDQGYEFVDRVGVFRRKRPRPGVVGFERMELPPGPHALRFWVLPAGGAGKEGSLELVLPPGESRTLHLSLDAAGELVVRLEAGEPAGS